MKGNHVIWTSDVDFVDWRDDLEEQYPDATEDELYRIMYETNADYLEDERINLNIQLPEAIVCIADLGLWNGRKSGYRVITSGNISDCLYSEYDPTWFVDRYGNLRCDAVHHDGTNHYLYRMWKPGLSDTAKENFLCKIYEGKATSADVSRYTRRIGDYIGKVYGWEVA